MLGDESPESKEERQAGIERARSMELADRQRALLEASGLSKFALQRTLESFRFRDPLQAEAVRIAKKFIERVPDVKRGLMIYGKTGTGKSHILKAVVHAVTQKQQPVKAYYVDCFGLQRMLKADPDLNARMLNCQLLALDDLEKGLGGDAAPWVRALIKSVIDSADSDGRPILLSTSEFSLDEHRDLGKMADYLAGRLGKLMYWQHIEGPNGREIEATEAAPWWL